MNNRVRIIKLLDILRSETDEEHPLNSEQLITRLQQEGLEAERKTIYADVEALNDCGHYVEKGRGVNGAGYYYDNKLFESAELRVLLDAVNASNFINTEKTEEMNRKLLSLTDKYDRQFLAQTTQYRHPKTENKQVYVNIDAIGKAIYHHKAIKFSYFDVDVRAQRRYRPRNYRLVPYAMVLNNERYYLIGFSEKHDDFSHYRIDKMDRIEEEETDHEFREFDINRYMPRLFQMFAGEPVSVTLDCKENLLSELQDQFGSEIMVTGRHGDWLTVTFKAQIAETFYSWLFTFQDKIRLLGPSSVIEEYRQRCLKIAQLYETERGE